MRYEEGPQTPFGLAQHIRRRIPEVISQCGCFRDLHGWRVQGEGFSPIHDAYPEESEADLYFYECLLDGWLRRAAYILNGLIVGNNGCNLISPLLAAWHTRLQEMLEDVCSGDS